jgi:hypothetical protein
MNERNDGYAKSLGESHFVLVGRSTPTYLENSTIASGNIQTIASGNIQSIEVGAMTVPMAVEDLGTDLDNKGLASFDTIFSPYINATGHAQLPHFETPTNLSEPNSLTLDPFNPNNIFDTGVSQATNNARFYESGHNIQAANTWTATGYGSSGDLSFSKDLGTNTSFSFTGVRSVGFKGPMVLSGWGFDTNGKPVPADTGNAEIFASGAFRDPNLWKTGPIDLRWDNERKVWGSSPTKIYLVKTLNTYNPSCFSYEVQRSTSRSQYTKDTLTQKTLGLTDPIHDPEQVAYDADPDNFGCFERLDYSAGEYPHYEAFIIRETSEDSSSATYYNLWTDDCQDCGHITSQCASGDFTRHGSDSTGKKILIENPLRQSLNVGDLAFTVKTGKTKNVNTGSFTGGSGSGATGTLTTDAGGVMTTNITASGSGYTNGAFAIITGNIATNVSLTVAGGEVTVITASPLTGYEPNQTYNLTIYPNDTTADTESLDIHWILQAEFSAHQVNTHVEANGGILQTCSMIVQTQGFSSCEQCGEDLSLVNNTI